MSHPHPELGPPPALPKGGLRIVPLGGLGEIGRNMTVFEFDGRLLVVDCGVLFPEETQPGVDVILPDFTWIRDRLDAIEAIVLTHGHEDHIGGVPYLLRERPDIPLVGSRLTLAFIASKLKEHRITPITVQVEEGDRRPFGAFDCEFVAVNHSIPDGLAVAIRTSAGMVLATGDFKMDQFPLDSPDHRPARLRPAGRGGRRPVHDGLDQRRRPRVHDLRARPGPGDRGGVPHRPPADHRLQLRQPRAPDPAGPRRRPPPRPQGRVRGPVDGAQHGHRPRPGLPHHPRGAGDEPQGDQEPAGQPDHAGLHRVAGRADGCPGADGQPRPRDPHRPRRHGPAGQLADPRERERHLPGDQRPDPLRRQRGPQGQREGPRLGPRQRRRAGVLLQHREAGQRAADPRRVAPPVGERLDRHPYRRARRGRGHR